MQSQDMQEVILSAVRDFAKSIAAGDRIYADMSSVIDATSSLPLAHFDHWERLIRDEFSRALNRTDQTQRWFWKGAENPLLLTWLDLISWDGYKREKTLRSISGPAPNAFFFSLAIRRLNDWVPRVREAAREALPKIAEATDPTSVVESLCVALSNWNSWGRIEDADRQVILKIISLAGVAKAFKQKLIASTAGPMSSLLSQLGRTPALDGSLEEIAESAIQPSVRAKAYRCLFEERMVWLKGREWVWTDIRYCEGRVQAVVAERKLDLSVPSFALIKKTAKDRSPIVRRVSAEFLIRNLGTLGEEARELAEYFAADKSSSVAERGEFALRQLGQ
ncbi:hypothetical protein ACJJIK_03110 [Microbulbifer sp. ZKSA006]|uniref:hypothetical protein n=1 Tax=Microbulbifer sp. ZKSA006 TaxID=3243390 RepID=UPI004039090C